MVKITGEGSGRLTEKILRHHDAADVTEVGSECELSLKIPRQSFHTALLSACYFIASFDHLVLVHVVALLRIDVI